jgi:general secretion pathway protein K
VLALVDDDRDTRWEADGQVRRLAWEGADIAVRVQSESGRIDLNRSPEPLLQGLIGQFFPLEEAEAMTDAVIDWRDRNDEPEPYGAERDDYLAAGFAYGPRNNAFYSVHELSQVMGFDRDKVDALLPYLTVHSRQSRIHAASAELPVLAAIPGITREAAEAFAVEREAALLNEEPLRFDTLNGGRRYLDTRPSQRIFSLELTVAIEGGYTRREHIVIRVDPVRGFVLLARDYLAAPVEGDGSQT